MCSHSSAEHHQPQHFNLYAQTLWLKPIPELFAQVQHRNHVLKNALILAEVHAYTHCRPSPQTSQVSLIENPDFDFKITWGKQDTELKLFPAMKVRVSLLRCQMQGSRACPASHLCLL